MCIITDEITFFTFLRNFQCKWMLLSIDLRKIACKHELLVDILRTASLLLLTFSPEVAFFFMILTLSIL